MGDLQVCMRGFGLDYWGKSSWLLELRLRLVTFPAHVKFWNPRPPGRPWTSRRASVRSALARDYYDENNKQRGANDGVRLPGRRRCQQSADPGARRPCSNLEVAATALTAGHGTCLDESSVRESDARLGEPRHLSAKCNGSGDAL